MAGIKLSGRVESLYKARTITVVSFVITVFLTTNYFRTKYLPVYLPDVGPKFVIFFSNSVLISFYGTLIGLLLAAYAVLVALIPSFSQESLQQPIFSQVNRLFLFTIFVGIILMIIDFTNGIIPDNSIPFFVQVEVFFFISLLIGLIFSVLSLSDLFRLLRKKGVRK